MKRLYIVRHGKSTWDYDLVKDEDRPLKERGIADSYKMAERLAGNGNIPEMMISSTGIRALHTAVIFHRVFGLPKQALCIDPDLYLADENDLMDIIFGFDDKVHSIMIFGHNPGFTDLANYLSNLNIMNIPTTGIVILDFDIEKWTETGRDKITKEYFDFPRKS